MTDAERHAKALWWAIRGGLVAVVVTLVLMFVPNAHMVALPLLLVALIGGGVAFLIYVACRVYYEDTEDTVA